MRVFRNTKGSFPNAKQHQHPNAMYCLEVIHSINNRKSVKSAVAERDCSFVRSRGGIVLHSARARDTVFIHPGRYADGVLARLNKLARKPGNRQALNLYIENLYNRAI